MLRREYDEGHHRIGSYLGNNKVGIRLGEKEQYERTLDATYKILLTTHSESGEPLAAKSLWFEDTTGQRYSIRGIKRNLKRIWVNISEIRLSVLVAESEVYQFALI